MFLAPPAPACLLPGAGDGSRIARQHRCVKVADVYAQLQRIRGHRTGELTTEKLSFDLTALLRKITGAVGHDFRWSANAYLGQPFFGIDVNQLGEAAGAGKGQGADILVHQLGKQMGGFAVGAAADALRLIDYGRIPENEVLATVRRAVMVNHLEWQSHQLLGMFPGVGNGRRAADELWLGTIETTQTP
ncbi:hypothetical protein ES707_17515 [subsurface metagenome]